MPTTTSQLLYADLIYMSVCHLRYASASRITANCALAGGSGCIESISGAKGGSSQLAMGDVLDVDMVAELKFVF